MNLTTQNALMKALEFLEEAEQETKGRISTNAALLHDNVQRLRAEAEYVLERFLDIQDWE